jgi:hypothetical protein
MLQEDESMRGKEAASSLSAALALAFLGSIAVAIPLLSAPTHRDSSDNYAETSVNDKIAAVVGYLESIQVRSKGDGER